MDLLAIAADWSFWTRPPPPAVPRDVVLPRALDPRVAVAVQGVRRCGKSTLLQQFMGHYGLDPARCVFINFEDPRLAAHLRWETLDALQAAFVARHGKASRKAPLVFFLDEIQWVPGWQRWLRAKLDQPAGCVFVVTGSNAQLLSGELGSSLTGRHLSVELMPFSFDEAQRAVPRLSVKAFLERGGFPEPLKSPDRDALLRQYVTDIVERDVRERVGARSVQPLRQLVQMVFESAGSELSMRRIAGALGVAVETVQAYVDACESAYLFFGCPFFAWSERQRATHQRKFYPIDSGLRRVSVTKTGEDVGKHLECATFLALRRRFGSVSYWRERGEVDFVVQRRDGKPVPVQVSWAGVQERHQRALEGFYERFPDAAEAVFVDRDRFASLASLEP
ncbi:MAG: ATP-binding protein [Proteobacteria bacterium]|nr:ATP-binding protein [Pseudomonadota bacterium]